MMEPDARRADAAGISAAEGGVWRERFEWLVDFCGSIEWHYDDESFYNLLAEELLGSMRADMVTIQLYDVTEVRLVGSAFANPDDAQYVGLYGQVRTSVGRFPQIIETHEPIVMHFDNPDERDMIVEEFYSLGLKTGLTLPIVQHDVLLGVINILSRKNYDLQPGDIECLMGMTSIVASFVVAREASVHFTEALVLDERRMLSAELHDNLSQMVNTVRLEAEQAMDSLENGDTKSLMRELKILDRASAMAVSVLRDEMLALRDSAENASSFIEEIKQMTERFEQMWGLHVDLTYSDNIQRLVLSKRVILQLTRVIHEALSNVSRHAHADSVLVDIRLNDAALSLRIVDDGCGFNLSDVSATRMGLRVMRERVEGINGELAVASEPGEGTTVLAVVPIGLGKR